MTTTPVEPERSDRVWTIPNLLSMLRLVGVPIFLWAILTKHDTLALVVLMLSGISDYLDGKIARKFNLISNLGALLDPIADRLYILSTLLGLAWREIIPWWLVGVLIAREVFLTLLLLYARTKGLREMPVHFVGKAATFNLLYAFPCLLLADGDSTLAQIARPIGWGFAWWGIVLYWVAGLMYAVQLRRYVRAATLHPTAT
ncbi:CDP-alcohol phosphatidyltransferase family protein [Nostocoides australiense]|uniref:Putative CDP-diacylglycerol--glycerol-3-phosphate 3-phosphatidyl-transferase n=1 Tax=Nostocoides australiense Ben110 TaxID=1193182 RepID=W6K3J2_9MICO|nr:CDP-alcohol phosphatidyltransferase family protein [Tetrasphaera australiensis]MCA0291559.1 CDP-alcohol phosphatidyltransferase family protein [Actinomycetota bacterium]CCH73359.1 putative CDP-diacylglycerol--glycerol-3-phosphate 3-phosphatidyl-transferase [Tetrasphaera australiensis Ben110]HPF80601.1 CDP-alcohol phosphatidyltransferase family protein [Tetrasphaera australiensis]HRW01208.1 CDP-alcohol phosphatidyltransferase family protein [Tetrasphaera sp.]